MARFGDLDTQYLDDAGNPLVNGKVYFYESGTTTLKNTFADVNLSIPNTNPVILTAAGRQPNIFFDGVAKAILTSNSDVQILVRDPVGETATDFGDEWVATKIYGANDVVLGSDGVYYRSLVSGNQNNNPVSTTNFWTLLYSVEWNAGITYQVGAVVTYDGEQYQSLQGSNLNQNPSTASSYWVLLSFAWLATATYSEDQNAVGTDGILYTSLQDSNTGNDPATSPAYWVGTSAAAAASATAAAASATAAAASETAAETAETNAETAQAAAEAAQAAAETAETNAETAETNAASSATAAASSASAASTSETNAATSATNAASSATAASGSASAAATSATNASNSASAAAASETAAETAETNAETAQTAAEAAQSAAETAETNAETAETNAASSASAAATSASNAATSASNASTSETNALNSANAAASSYDQFDDRYLGDKASDPTLDNDGNALLTGALYFNTTSDVMRVYNGSAWQDTAISPNSPTFTGTVTADGLTVDGAWPLITLNDTRNSNNWNYGDVVGELKFTTDDSGLTNPIASIRAVHNRLGTGHSSNDAGLEFYASATTTGTIAKRMSIESVTGDISFYEDTGTTPKFFWDASAESLGIGTTSPTAPLSVLNAASTATTVQIGSSTLTHNTGIYLRTTGVAGLSWGSGGDLAFYGGGAGTTERMRIDASGNVGIGASSPAYRLDTQVSSATWAARVLNTNASGAGLLVRTDSTSNNIALGVYGNGAYRMVVAADGNVGIGNTAPQYQLDLNTTGSNTLFGAGISASTASGPLNLSLSSWGQSGGRSGIITFTTGSATNGTERMRIDSSGNVGIGTSSPAAKFHVYGGSSGSGVDVATFRSASGAFNIKCSDLSAANPTWTLRTFSAEPLAFGQGSDERMRIDSSGNVGIGTDSPQGELHIKADTPSLYIQSDDGQSCDIIFGNVSDQSRGRIRYDSSDNMIFQTNNLSEKMRITYSGFTGIGTANPDTLLHISASLNPTLRIENIDPSASVNQSIGRIEFEGQDTSTNASGVRALIDAQYAGAGGQGRFVFQLAQENSASLSDSVILNYGTQQFFTNNTERMRIDSSGNLLVGKTVQGIATSGVELTPNDRAAFTKSGGAPILVNRTSNDGEIINLRKDGTTVGSIGAGGGNLNIGNGTANLRFTSGSISPSGNTAGGSSDGVTDLGISNRRFKDLYLSGGVLADTLTFKNLAGAERMRIDSSGFFVGKTAPDFASGGFEVRNDGISGFVRNAPSASLYIVKPTATHTTGDMLEFRYNATTTVGRVSYTATSVSYVTSSDQRLKENIADADDAGSKVDSIQVRQFDWKADGSHQDYGMVAQELMTVAPEAVTQSEDAEEMMGVDYSKLVPMLIKEIQSLRNRVATLEGN